MSYPGTDRRARGLWAALRRSGYGLLLWCSQVGAVAALGEEPTLAPLRAQVEIVALTAAPASYRVTSRIQDPRLSPGLQRFTERLGLALQGQETISPLARIGDGVGIDFRVRQAGTLHLLLSARGDDLAETPHWTLTEPAPQPQPMPQLWSFGAAVESVALAPDALDARHQPELGGQVRRKAFAQQLRFDVDQLLGWQGDAVMTLQRSPWIDRESGRRSAAIVQVHLKWRF